MGSDKAICVYSPKSIIALIQHYILKALVHNQAGFLRVKSVVQMCFICFGL